MGNYIFRQRLQPLAAKITRNAILSFATLGIASGIWLAVEHKLPQIAHTRPTVDSNQGINTELALDRRPNETYEALRDRAVADARAAARESLATNRQATNVTVTVVVRDRGQIAPILSLTANRNQGVSDPRQGIKYFDQARSLLRFDDDVATNDGNGAPQRPLPNRTPAASRTPTNSNPSNTRSSGDGSFSQPGRLVPPTPGQPTNTTPFGQPGTTNPINNTPSGQTPPGTGLVPQPSSTNAEPTAPTNQPTTNPATSPGTPISPNTVTPSSSGNLSSPSTTTPTSPGTGLNPAAPTAPSGVTPSQPLTPSGSPLGTGSTFPNP